MRKEVRRAEELESLGMASALVSSAWKLHGPDPIHRLGKSVARPSKSIALDS